MSDRRQRDDANHVKLPSPLIADCRRPERGVAALRNANRQPVVSEVAFELVGSEHDVSDASRLGLSDEIRMDPGGPQSLVIGLNNGVAASQEAVEYELSVYRRVGAFWLSTGTEPRLIGRPGGTPRHQGGPK